MESRSSTNNRGTAYEEFIRSADENTMQQILLVVFKYLNEKSARFTLDDSEFMLIAEHRQGYTLRYSDVENTFRKMLDYGFFDSFERDYFDSGARCEYRIAWNEQGLAYCLDFFKSFCFRRVDEFIRDKDYRKYRDFYDQFKFTEERDFLRSIKDYKRAYSELDSYMGALDPQVKPHAFDEFRSKANRFMEFLPVIENIVERFDDITKRVTYPVTSRLVTLMRVSRVSLILSVVFFVVTVIVALLSVLLRR